MNYTPEHDMQRWVPATVSQGQLLVANFGTDQTSMGSDAVMIWTGDYPMLFSNDEVILVEPNFYRMNFHLLEAVDHITTADDLMAMANYHAGQQALKNPPDWLTPKLIESLGKRSPHIFDKIDAQIRKGQKTAEQMGVDWNRQLPQGFVDSLTSFAYMMVNIEGLRGRDVGSYTLAEGPTGEVKDYIIWEMTKSIAQAAFIRPSMKKKKKSPYLPVVLEWVLNGSVILPEDVDKIREALVEFEQARDAGKLKGSIETSRGPKPKGEINSYPTLPSLMEELDSMRDVVPGARLNCEGLDGVEIIHQENYGADADPHILRVYEITSAEAMKKCGGIQPNGRRGTSWCVVQERWFCNYKPERYYMFTTEVNGEENWMGLLHPESSQWKDANDAGIGEGWYDGKPSATQSTLIRAEMTVDDYASVVIPVLEDIVGSDASEFTGDLAGVDPDAVLHDIDVILEYPSDWMGNLNYNVEKWEWGIIEAVTDKDVDQLDGLIAYAMGQQDTDPHANEIGVTGPSADTPPDGLVEFIDSAIQTLAGNEMNEASKGSGGWLLPGEVKGQQTLPGLKVQSPEEAHEAWFHHIYQAIYDQDKGYEKWVKKLLKIISEMDIRVAEDGYDREMEVGEIAKWRNAKSGDDQKLAWEVFGWGESQYDSFKQYRDEIAAGNYENLNSAWYDVHEYATGNLYENLWTSHPEMY